MIGFILLFTDERCLVKLLTFELRMKTNEQLSAGCVVINEKIN